MTQAQTKQWQQFIRTWNYAVTRSAHNTTEEPSCPQCRSNAVVLIRDAHWCKHCGTAWKETDEGIEYVG